MIYLKNAQQLDLMRKSGALLYEVLCRLREAIKPGMSTAELDVYAEQLIRKHKAIPSFLDYQGYPASICASVNDEVVHGIPSDKTILKEGDVLSIDCGLILDGWQSDSAFTVGVGAISEENRKLIEVTEESFYKGVRKAVNGNHLGDIGNAIQTYAESFGQMAYITKATAQLMRDLGSIQSPENAFLLNLGLETLHLRVKRHCENAQAVAEWLQNDPRVAWVNYAGLPGNKYYELGKKYLPDGICGVIALGLKGSREEAIRFMDNLRMICIVTHVADARTCVLHPASHTHRQLSDEQLREAGVAPDLIRLSVGIEDVDDIIADLRQALDSTFGA